MKHGRARAFWAAFYLTLCFFASAAAMLTVDHRCRTAVSPTETITADFYWDSAADGEGSVRVQWFDLQAEICFRPSEKLQKLFQTLPALIPRPLRAAALLQHFLPDPAAENKKAEEILRLFI